MKSGLEGRNNTARRFHLEFLGERLNEVRPGRPEQFVPMIKDAAAAMLSQ